MQSKVFLAKIQGKLYEIAAIDKNEAALIAKRLDVPAVVPDIPEVSQYEVREGTLENEKAK